MSAFPSGWALQKPVQTIEPAAFEKMWQQGLLIPTRKRDGNRAHILTAGENTRIYSRNGTLDWTEKLGHIASAFAKAPSNLLLDVELHTAEEGTHTFQDAMNRNPEAVLWSAFDALRLDGSLTSHPYEERAFLASQIEDLVAGEFWGGGVFFHLPDRCSYDEVLARIEKAGCEGVVVWDRTASHSLNTNGNTKRGRAWKIKIRQTEDLVVTGWNPNKGDPALGAGSLELERQEAPGKRVKAGKVGSFDKGFDRHAAMTRPLPYIVEVSHYGIDENGNMTFPKIERYRDDLAADFGFLKAA